MNNQHLNQEDLTLFYYGEHQSPQAVQAHLNQCETCRGELQSLDALLSLVSGDEAPQRGLDYPMKVWERLQPHLQQKPAPWSFLFRPALWGTVGAFAVLFAIVFSLGRLVGPDVTPAELGQHAGRMLFQTTMERHLDRLQLFWLDAGRETDGLSEAQLARARQLVDDNRLYRRVALQQNQIELAGLLDDLEIVMLEIANNVEGNGQEQTLVSSRERSEMLFKLSMMRSEISRARTEIDI